MVLTKISGGITGERDALLHRLEYEAQVGWTNVSRTSNNENLRKICTLVYETLWETTAHER